MTIPNSIDRARHINPDELMRHMRRDPGHTVTVYDVEAQNFGPNVALTAPPMSSIAGDQLSLRIDLGGLHANTPQIRAVSPTGGVAISTEGGEPRAIGGLSTLLLNIVVEPLIGGTLDHRTVYLNDQNGNRLLAIRIPLSDAPRADQFERTSPSFVQSLH